MNDFLILVDEKDQQWGKLEKLLVHELGLLHRAFSVFIFNKKGEVLLQQRADSKYHSPGLWTNTCCSHPQFGEDLSFAIDRRLMEEMNIKCETEFAFSFVYKASFENGLTEHEYDHVYFGISDEVPIPEASEVKNWKYVSMNKLELDVKTHPTIYTEWMKICLPQVREHYNKHFAELFFLPSVKSL